jgi:hypothetical protein
MKTYFQILYHLMCVYKYIYIYIHDLYIDAYIYTSSVPLFICLYYIGQEHSSIRADESKEHSVASEECAVLISTIRVYLLYTINILLTHSEGTYLYRYIYIHIYV